MLYDTFVFWVFCCYSTMLQEFTQKSWQKPLRSCKPATHQNHIYIISWYFCWLPCHKTDSLHGHVWVIFSFTKSVIIPDEDRPSKCRCSSILPSMMNRLYYIKKETQIAKYRNYPHLTSNETGLSQKLDMNSKMLHSDILIDNSPQELRKYRQKAFLIVFKCRDDIISVTWWIRMEKLKLWMNDISW